MNKREQQRLIREQKQKAADRRAQRQRTITRIGLVVFVPLLLIAVVYGLIGQGAVYAPDRVAEVDHVRGNPDGVLFMVYADFQCPACATEARLMAQAWPRVQNEVKLVFRHYPLTDSHPHAWTAATYAEAAGRQGRFWEMYEMLFANQAYWSTLSDASDEFDGYLEELGLDVEQARNDRRDPDLLQKIRNDQRGGTRAGVRGTPTLFVDGRLVPTPRTVTDITSLLRRAQEARS